MRSAYVIAVVTGGLVGAVLGALAPRLSSLTNGPVRGFEILGRDLPATVVQVWEDGRSVLDEQCARVCEALCPVADDLANRARQTLRTGQQPESAPTDPPVSGFVTTGETAGTTPAPAGTSGPQLSEQQAVLLAEEAHLLQQRRVDDARRQAEAQAYEMQRRAADQAHYDWEQGRVPRHW